MTSLTPGANAPLSEHDVTVTVRLGPHAEPAALLATHDDTASGPGDFVPAGGPSSSAGLAWAPVAEGEGAWQLRVNLDALPPAVAKVRVVACLPEHAGTFGQRAAGVSVDGASGSPQATFEAAGAGAVTSLVLVELYRRQDAWKVRAVGQGYAGGRTAMLTDHGLDPAAVPAPATPPAQAAATSTASTPTIRYERPDRSPTPATPTPAEPQSPTAPPPSPAGAPIRYERPDRTPAQPAAAAPPQPVAPAPAIQAQPTRPAPTVTGPQPLWDLVDRAPEGKQLARPVAWSLPGAEFSWTERVRDLLPDSDSLPPGMDRFALAEQCSRTLLATHGSGFEYTWRGPTGQLLSPPWITLRSVLHDPATGRVVAAGHLNHPELGLYPAYDLGALNGANGLSWPQQGYTDGLFYPTLCLYIGSTQTGSLVPVDSSTNHGSVDLDPFTGTIAVLEQLGSTACISVYDGATGVRRRLAVIEQITGNETLRFSLDGEWLLLPRYDGAYLCEVATGRITRLPATECCWWPLADSTLLDLTEVDGRRVPRLFSLETGSYVHEFPAVSFDGEADPGVSYLARPAVSPDGAELLVVTPAGVPPQQRAEHGVAGHLGRVTLTDGRGRLVAPAMLDAPFLAERDVSEARWAGPYPYREVHLAPSLQAQLEEPLRQHEHLAADRYAPEAEALLVTALNRCVNLFQQGQDATHLMPEVVMSMITLRAEPPRWDGQNEWLNGIASTVTGMVSDGTLWGRAAAGWMSFARAYIQIAATGRSTVSPAEVAWVSS